MNRILLSIIRKEFRHIQRDPQTLAIILLWPLIMLFLFGYAITLDMRQIETVIVDESKTPQSRAFIEKIMSTDFFKITGVDFAADSYDMVFKERQARCILVIPYDFSQELSTKPNTKIQLIIDASDPNAANYINKYFSQINMQYIFDMNDAAVIPFSVESKIFYNPDLKSDYFFVPGLIAIILLMISALLTSIAIVREKEMGTMEQVLVSPVHASQIIIGKVIPYTMIGFVDAVLILLTANLWFGVPVNGSVLLLLLSLIIYIIAGLSFGLLVSTVTKSQKVAMLAAIMATLLPTLMMSGFIFPIASMPLVFQYLSQIIPATHFLDIIRGIMLKGVGFNELAKQMGILVLIALVLNAVSIKKFKTTLES